MPDYDSAWVDAQCVGVGIEVAFTVSVTVGFGFGFGLCFSYVATTIAKAPPPATSYFFNHSTYTCVIDHLLRGVGESLQLLPSSLLLCKRVLPYRSFGWFCRCCFHWVYWFWKYAWLIRKWLCRWLGGLYSDFYLRNRGKNRKV